MSRYNYSRRKTSVVHVGDVTIGGSNPIRLQSMTNTSTLDITGSAAQAKRIADAGGEIVRLTTQGSKEAAALSPIKEEMQRLGCDVPLVADVHFNPKAAFVAAQRCEKVRINPGNFVDAPRQFKHLEYSDEEYAAELNGIREALVPFLDLCKKHNTAIRLGVNHGSLSDRIMSRFGNTAEGMVESAMEFLNVCIDQDFLDVVISIKASNTVVMTETVRLLVERMDRNGMHFPIHLGVTEAGDGEDGRIKSAVGIGTLLNEGIGDTIRVSLSEDPEKEIPVAALLRDYITAREGHSPVTEPRNPIPDTRGIARSLTGVPDDVAIAGVDFIIDDNCHFVNAASEPQLFPDLNPVVLHSDNSNRPGEVMAYIDRCVALGVKNPFIVQFNYSTANLEALQVMSAADFGTVLLNGYASGILINAPAFDHDTLRNLAEGILQATRIRFSRPEYIACPGCGRTLFDLQSTLQQVKNATKDLKGLKIGVMGCIVNGPGEMADADYGYVGAGPGRVSLYKGKDLVVKNIPADDALPLLLKLIEGKLPV